MATLKNLQDQVNAIVSGPPLGARAAGLTATAARATAGRLPAVAPATAPGARRLFSEFVSEDVEQAVAIAADLIKIANQKGGEDGLAEALAEVARLNASGFAPGLIQHAVKLFVTHHPAARKAFPWKPLEQRQSGLVVPSTASPQAGASPTGVFRALRAEQPVGSTAPENRVDFWREDPLINEHHEHWHLVYPQAPLPPPTQPVPAGGYKLGNRHGELFAYMHEQMLARYDAERIAVDLPRVVSFDDYTVPISEGYNPGPLRFWDSGAWTSFRPRPPGATLSDLKAPFDKRPGAKLATQATFRDRLLAAAETGFYEVDGKKVPANIEWQGNTEEANNNAVDYYPNLADGTRDPRSRATYGNHHNDGHIHFMFFDNTAPFGVMGTTATAVRDPVFFRWHKQVDNIYQALQKRLPPYSFADDAPPVRMRKSTLPNGQAHSQDIILCRQYEFPTEVQFDDDDAIVPVDGDNVGQALFGYSTDPGKNHWDEDFSVAKTTVDETFLVNGEPVTKTLVVRTTDELHTAMLERSIVASVGQTENGQPILQAEKIHYLSHDDYYYFLRLENVSQEKQSVTVRIFLAPEANVEDKTSWIEMDRFVTSLEPLQKSVIYRPADMSAVVRQPALKWQDLNAQNGPSPTHEEGGEQAWCDCGWPYTLLLPRGTKEGMAFRLFVMLSPGSDITLKSAERKCTSMAYCGVKDDDYPDSRPMGYPFDRPFASGISATVNAQDNMAWRTIKIRCVK